MFGLTLPVIAIASATSLYFSAACMPSLVLPEPTAPGTWMARGTKAQGREELTQTMQGIARHPAWDTRDVLARHLPQKGCMEKTGR